MKPIYLLSVLFFFSLRAQAPVPLAHGDVPGEPHHHLKIENSYVRAYYVEVPPHDATQLHQHDHDYIFVTLGASDVTNAVLGKPEVHLQLKDGEVHFTRGGFAHVARNNSGAPFRNVTIEFLRSQGAVQNHCEKVVDGPVESCSWSAVLRLGGGLMRLFHTESVNAFFGLVQPKASLKFKHFSDALVVAMGQSVLGVSSGKSRVILDSGEMSWVPPGKKMTVFKNQGDRDARFLILLFERTDAISAPKS